MEVGELIMVAIIVVILLVIGFVGYSLFQTQSLQESGEEFASLSTIRLAQEVASMQEIRCGFDKETSSECIDRYSLTAFSKRLNETGPESDLYNYYRSKFGAALITVQQVYPSKKRWVVYNQSGGAGQIPVQLPVYIYDPLHKNNSFGVLRVVRFT